MFVNHKLKIASVILGFVTITCVKPGFTQEEIFSLGMPIGPGARAMAMGGAYASVGGDYAASWWNPAALRGIRRVEFYGSMSHLKRDNDFGLINNLSAFTNTANKNEDTFTRLNDFGIAYPIPTTRGSLVLSFGFNRVKSYDSNLKFETFNQTPDDSVNQAWRELEDGTLNAWTLAGAMDISPNVSLGVGLNFWQGGSDFESTFREQDRDDIYTFDAFTNEQTLNTDITGFNAKFGGLFRMGKVLHLGVTISTPVTFNVEEEWSTFDETLFDDNTFADSLDSGVFEYDIKSPWSFTSGASLHLLNLVVSAEAEYNDWTQIEYKSPPPIDGLTEASANRLIEDNYRATTRIRLGAEFTLPLTGLSFRAGYFKDPSIFEGVDDDEDKEFYSAGVGFLIDKQVKLDVAYIFGTWKRFNTGLSGSDDIVDYVEDIETHTAMVSLAFRL